MGKYFKLYKILKCPINIPLNDLDAWSTYPEHRWVYNRLEIALFQNIECAPMPILPNKYPIIIKPIINMYGMGLNVLKINNEEEFFNQWHNNNFWMEFLEGDHLSFDIILNNGQILYNSCFKGHKNEDFVGKFDYWESLDIDNNNLPKIIYKLIDEHFKNFYGCLNVEIIGDKIIECHLRMGDIDKFPILEILKGIIKVYEKDGLNYDWSKINVCKLFFFPIWIKKDVVDKKLFKFLKKKISPLLEKNQYICEYEIDDDSLATPCQEKRVMWFTTYAKEYGDEIKKSIFNELSFFL